MGQRTKETKEIAMQQENIQAVEEEIIADFELFDDWTQKYEYIIELGQQLPALDEQFKKDEYKIKGCQSSVWLNAYEKDGLLFLKPTATLFL